jgi:hypothetical protein
MDYKSPPRTLLEGTAMSTRRWFLSIVTLGLFSVLSRPALAGPQVGDANLRETLVFGLKPRLPEENAFIDLVLLRVDQKVLPLDLVISTFRWAQGRKPYPMPFFQRALVVRAAKLGINLS